MPLAGLLAAALLLWPPLAAADPSYPARPVTLVVTVSAGGSIDIIARALTDGLRREFGKPFVVENKAGANGNLAAQSVGNAAPDGHTLLVTGGSTLNLNPFVYKDLPFHPTRSFAPITLTARTNFILAIHPRLGVDSLAGFLAHGRAHPGRLNYGSAGNGSLIHVASELFNGAVGIAAQHVPFRGLAPAMISLLAGEIDYMFDSATGIEHIKAGKLKSLAVVGPNRLAELPQLATLAELGVAGMEAAAGWHGLFAPAATPAAIMERLNVASVKVLSSEAVRARISALGAEPATSAPAALAAQLAGDLERLDAVVKRMNLVAQ